MSAGRRFEEKKEATRDSAPGCSGTSVFRSPARTYCSCKVNTRNGGKQTIPGSLRRWWHGQPRRWLRTPRQREPRARVSPCMRACRVGRAVGRLWGSIPAVQERSRKAAKCWSQPQGRLRASRGRTRTQPLEKRRLLPRFCWIQINREQGISCKSDFLPSREAAPREGADRLAPTAAHPAAKGRGSAGCPRRGPVTHRAGCRNKSPLMRAGDSADEGQCTNEGREDVSFTAGSAADPLGCCALQKNYQFVQILTFQQRHQIRGGFGSLTGERCSSPSVGRGDQGQRPVLGGSHPPPQGPPGLSVPKCSSNLAG